MEVQRLLYIVPSKQDMLVKHHALTFLQSPGQSHKVVNFHANLKYLTQGIYTPKMNTSPKNRLDYIGNVKI